MGARAAFVVLAVLVGCGENVALDPAASESVLTTQAATTTTSSAESQGQSLPNQASTSTASAVSTIAPTTASDPATITVVSTVESIPATPAVTIHEPPALIEPHPFAYVDANMTAYVGLGDGYAVAARRDGELVIVPSSGAEIRSIPVERVPRNFIVGPHSVLYGEVLDFSTDESASPTLSFVAIALEGPRSGDELLSTDGLPHAMDPWGPFYAHAPEGVIDRWHDDLIVTPYLDPLGGVDNRDEEWAVVRLTQLTFPPRRDAPNDYEVTDGSTTWRFSVQRDPNAPSHDETYAWPGADGTAVYTTSIGPRIGEDWDYGTPTQRVIGVLAPDGSSTWHGLPDGWFVADSNRWGTLLAHHSDGRLELAMFEP